MKGSETYRKQYPKSNTVAIKSTFAGDSIVVTPVWKAAGRRDRGMLVKGISKLTGSFTVRPSDECLYRKYRITPFNLWDWSPPLSAPVFLATLLDLPTDSNNDRGLVHHPFTRGDAPDPGRFLAGPLLQADENSRLLN